MRYSLGSQVRGTLLGAALGEMIGRTVDPTEYEWERLTVLGIRSLIRLGRFDLDDWCSIFSSVEKYDFNSEQNPVNFVPMRTIAATLPLALFYHENEVKLRQNLQHLLVAWQNEPVSRDGALAVGYAIAQSLTHRLNSASLIPQTIAFVGSQSHLTKQLSQVQMLLEQRAGLERVVNHLGAGDQSSTPIALAFYCFLSTLEDLRLSVMRAAQKGVHPQITSAITGALSGAYNSAAGIPATLRMALSQSDNKLWTTWGMTTAAEMLELSDSLVAVWAGVYDQSENLFKVASVAAIAAPNVIRLR